MIDWILAQLQAYEHVFIWLGVGSVLLGGADAENTALAAAEGLEVHAWTWTMCRGGDLLAERLGGLGFSVSRAVTADEPDDIARIVAAAADDGARLVVTQLDDEAH